MSVFSRQFATLIASGMPMLRSLYTLEDQTEDERLKDAIAGVRNDVEAGSSLADAMERRPQIFDKLFRAMVRSGESSGRLDDALERIAFQLEKLDALKRQIRSAVIYPAFVFAAALADHAAVVIFIVPVFAEVFKEAVADQPGESACPADPDPAHDQLLELPQGLLVHLVPRHDRRRSASSNGRRPSAGGRSGTASSSVCRSTSATSSRRPRGALVADLLRRRRLGCAAAASIKLTGQTAGNTRSSRRWRTSTPR